MQQERERRTENGNWPLGAGTSNRETREQFVRRSRSAREGEE